MLPAASLNGPIGVAPFPRPRYSPRMDPVLSLRALAAIIADEPLRERFLALTGYDAPTLRARAGESDVQRAVIAFLTAHEPDLLRVAGDLGVKPEELARAA